MSARIKDGVCIVEFARWQHCLRLLALLKPVVDIKSIKSNLFAISSVHDITIHKFALRLAGQTGDNFALMSAHDS